MYRLNMQIGALMQHVIFPDNDSAMSALRKLFTALMQGASSLQLNGTAYVDPSSVSFAIVVFHDRT